MALTMLSSRGRSEGGALWGRRYVKKNLGQRNQGLSGPALGGTSFLYANLGTTQILPGSVIPQVCQLGISSECNTEATWNQHGDAGTC